MSAEEVGLIWSLRVKKFPVMYQSSVCATFLHDLTYLLSLSSGLGSFLSDEADIRHWVAVCSPDFYWYFESAFRNGPSLKLIKEMTMNSDVLELLIAFQVTIVWPVIVISCYENIQMCLRCMLELRPFQGLFRIR